MSFKYNNIFLKTVLTYIIYVNMVIVSIFKITWNMN